MQVVQVTILEKLKFRSWCNKIISPKEILTEVTATTKNFIFTFGVPDKFEVMETVGNKYKVWKYDPGD